MHRPIMAVAAVALAVSLLALTSQAPVPTRGQTGVTYAQDYGHPAVYNVGEPDGETLTGNACNGFGSGLTWYVFSAVFASSNVYSVQSQVYGYDICSGQSQARYDMGGDGTPAYNTSQAQAGWYSGLYQGCGQGHSYETFAVGYEEQSNGSTTYGANGWWYGGA